VAKPNKTNNRSDQLHLTHVCVGAAMVNDRRSFCAKAAALAASDSTKLAGQHRAGVPTLVGRVGVIRTWFNDFARASWYDSDIMAARKKRFFERMVGSPAEALDKTIGLSKKAVYRFENQRMVVGAKNFWHGLGPGLTTGASDDDCSGIATYSQAGARYGLTFAWLATVTFPLMAVVQEMCARIGLATGRGLASNIRRFYPRWFLYIVALALLAANTFNIGADLGAMAKAMQLILPLSSFALWVVLFAGVSLLMQVFMTYKKYAYYLKLLALVLLAYIIVAFVIPGFPWGEVGRAAITPSFSWSRDSVILICGILGTTISPYLFFWQTSQEIEEEVSAGKTTLKARRDVTPQEIKAMRTDVWSGMFLSNVVMFFIIAVCGVVLFRNGVTNIASAADAANALRPLAGDGAYALFALGIVGVGLLAMPVLAGSASYAISESFGWRDGLFRNLKSAYAFYGVIIISMIAGLACNFFGLDPIKALIYAAVLNGLVAPLVLIPIVAMSASKKIMGQWKSHPLTSTIGWLVTALMAVSGVATLIVW